MRSRASVKKAPKKPAKKKAARKPAAKKAKAPAKKKETKPLKRQTMSFDKAVKRGLVKRARAFQWLSSDNPKVFFEHLNRMRLMTGELDAGEVMTAIGKSMATKAGQAKKWPNGWAHEVRVKQLIELLGVMHAKEMAPALANVNLEAAWGQAHKNFQNDVRHAVVKALNRLEPETLGRLKYIELTGLFDGPQEAMALADLKRKFQGRQTRWPRLSESLRQAARNPKLPLEQRIKVLDALNWAPERENINIFTSSLVDFFKGRITTEPGQEFSLMMSCMSGLYRHRKLAREPRELIVAADVIEQVVKSHAERFERKYGMYRKRGETNTLEMYGKRILPDIYLARSKLEEAKRSGQAGARPARKKK